MLHITAAKKKIEGEWLMAFVKNGEQNLIRLVNVADLNIEFPIFAHELAAKLGANTLMYSSLALERKIEREELLFMDKVVINGANFRFYE